MFSWKNATSFILNEKEILMGAYGQIASFIDPLKM
jgi:hypothetical protein